MSEVDELLAEARERNRRNAMSVDEVECLIEALDRALGGLKAIQVAAHYGDHGPLDSHRFHPTIRQTWCSGCHTDAVAAILRGENDA